jgi:hypothetical protein
MASPYFAADGATYPWYTNTFSAAVYDPNTNFTWFAWEAWTGSQRAVKVRRFNHAARRWSPAYTVSISPLTNDDHGVPSICRDHQGYWHVFFGAHLSALYHSVTVNPDDPSVWTARPAINPNSAGVTYPHPVPIGSAIYLFLRYGDYGVVDDTPLILMKTTALSAGVETWGAAQTICDYGSNTRFYQGPAIDRGGKIHFVGTKADRADTERTDVHYFIYDTSDGSLKNHDESISTASGSLPVSLATMDAAYRVYTSANSGDIPDLCFDSDGNPHVLYMDGSGTAWDIYHTALLNGSWTAAVQIGTAHSRYSEFCIAQGASGTVQAYWTEDDGAHTDGGNLKTAVRSAGSGGSWGSASTAIVAGTKALNEPQQVLSGTSDARMIFAEVAPTSNDADAGGLKLYARGDTDFLREMDTPLSLYNHSPLTIDHTQVPATLSNFPVLVRITDSRFKTAADGGNVQNANGFDILFSPNSDGSNPYFWEMESYDGAAGAIVAWVMVPSVSPSVDTVFYAVYGFAGISTFQSTPSSVWNANYAAVYHFGAGLNVSDSTINANDGTNHGASAASGETGGGVSFSAGNYVSVPNAPPINFGSGDFSIEFWAKLNVTGGTSAYLLSHEKSTANYNGYGILVVASGEITNPNRLAIETSDGTLATSTCSSNINDNAFHHIVVTRTGSTIAVYVDGVAETVTGPGRAGNLAQAVPLDIGIWNGDNASNPLFGSILDEIRFSNALLTTSWITASYNNQKSASTFLTLGSEAGATFRRKPRTSLRLGLRAA